MQNNGKTIEQEVAEAADKACAMAYKALSPDDLIMLHRIKSWFNSDSCNHDFRDQMQWICSFCDRLIEENGKLKYRVNALICEILITSKDVQNFRRHL